MELGKQIINRLQSMKAERQEYESHWRECYRMTFPHRGTGFAGETSPHTARGQQAELLDSTGTEAANVLAASIVSGMTPSNSQWLNLISESKSDNVDRWLSEVATILWKNIHSSNFDAETFECAIDGVVGGSFALYIDIDRTRGGFNFQQWPLSQCYFSSTTGQLIDIVYRCYKLTAQQAQTLFPGALSESMQKAAESKPYEKYDFIHAIYPRGVYQAGGKTGRNMPYASVHVSVNDGKLLREGGYQEFPLVAPRWSRIPGSVYATGAASLALPDIKELNELKRWEKQAAELAVAGMWIAEDDGVLNPGTLTVGPRKVIVANSVDSMKPLLTGSDFNVAFSSEERLQTQIRKIMMADTLAQPNGPAMTATEVQARLNLLRQQLGPIFGRYQAEYLTPMVERCFGLMFRAGALPQPPAEMNGVNFHVHFDNPLARAQKMTEVSAIEQLEAGLMNLAQSFPDVIDMFDMEEAQREKAEALGVPVSIIRSKEAVEGIRQQRQQAQQAQMQQEQANQMQLQNNQAANDQTTQAQAAA